jgi:hypothetical protein
MFRAYHVCRFPRYGGKICLRSGYEALILARPTTMGCLHQAVRLTWVSSRWVVMSLE